MFWRKRKERDRDLERELRSDLELEAEEQRENGVTEQEARYAARRAFGNASLIKEDGTTWGRMAAERFWQDLRYAPWQLKKTPGFAIAVIVTFALGIGANSALFTVTDAVLLKMLPVHDPERLVVVGAASPKHAESGFAMPYPAYEQIRDHNEVFSSVLAMPMPISQSVSAISRIVFTRN